MKYRKCTKSLCLLNKSREVEFLDPAETWGSRLLMKGGGGKEEMGRGVVDLLPQLFF